MEENIMFLSLKHVLQAESEPPVLLVGIVVRSPSRGDCSVSEDKGCSDPEAGVERIR